MQIVSNPQRVSLSNLCPWAASWVGCREGGALAGAGESCRLQTARLAPKLFPAGTHLQLNRPHWLTGCLALPYLNKLQRLGFLTEQPRSFSFLGGSSNVKDVFRDLNTGAFGWENFNKLSRHFCSWCLFKC